jgi:hypothetical protein
MRDTMVIETTGFADLDHAVAAFLSENPDVEEMREPVLAWGRCEEISERLAEFLTGRGFSAYCCRDEIGAFYTDAEDSAKIGAGDFTYPEHAVVEVYNLDGMGVLTVCIDFTAAQYGFTEFPKIIR